MRLVGRQNSHWRSKATCVLPLTCMIMVLPSIAAGGEIAQIKLDPSVIVIPRTSVDANSPTTTRVIEVSNEGTGKLTLRSLGSTCGCVSAATYPTSLAPGEKGRIEVEINGPKLSVITGSKQQRLMFATNDPQRPHVAVDVIVTDDRRHRAVLVSPAEIVRELSSEEFQRHAGVEKIFVFDLWSKRLEITEVETSPNLILRWYDITYWCPQGVSKHYFRLDPELSRFDGSRTQREWIRLSTNHPEFPHLTIPITYHPRSMIRILPKTVVFDRLTVAAQKTIRVECLDPADELKLGRVSSADPWLIVTQAPVDSGVIELRARIAETTARSGEMEKGVPFILQSTITIEVVKPEERLHTIDVLALR